MNADWEPFDPKNPDHLDKTKYEMTGSNDVWTHTLLCVDEAAKLTQGMDDETRMVIMLSVFAHDLGKPETTAVDAEGVTRALGHSGAGEAPTRSFLARLKVPYVMTEKVVALVKEHLAPFELFGAKVKLSAVRRLANRLHPATVKELCMVASADKRGRGPTMPKDVKECEWLLERAEEASVVHNKPLPFVTGKELIELGFTPGKLFGELQALAESWREDEELNKEEVLQRLANLEER